MSGKLIYVRVLIQTVTAFSGARNTGRKIGQLVLLRQGDEESLADPCYQFQALPTTLLGDPFLTL